MMDKIKEEIIRLISLQQEGPFWDFKKEWYKDGKEADLLLDIICMANNLKNRDAYIIIGVDEENAFSINSTKKDVNRKNTQNLTDFLKDKKFAGDFRPTVTVENLEIEGNDLDVIIVHNSLNTPFYLSKSFKNQVYANNIYVRLQNSNTPRDRTADMFRVEMLWKKRFGLLSSPLEKLDIYLQQPYNWQNSPSHEDCMYYIYAPEYWIEHNSLSDKERNGYEYYLFAQSDSRPRWTEIKIYYHQTLLVELGAVILDGGRYFTPTPSTTGLSLNGNYSWDITYKYFIKGELKHLVHLFYYQKRTDDERIAHDKFEECILIFESEEERVNFNLYAIKNWHRKNDYDKNIWVPHMPQIEGYIMSEFENEYRNVQILKIILKEFRIQK